MKAIFKEDEIIIILNNYYFNIDKDEIEEKIKKNIIIIGIEIWNKIERFL